MKKYKYEEDTTEARLAIILNRLANGRKTTWKFYKEYVVTDQGEILYQEDFPHLSWEKYVPID